MSLISRTAPLKWSINTDHGFVEGLFFIVLARPVWAACIVWVIFACAAGHGEPMRTMFNRHSVMVLSRLSYCFYLVSTVICLVKMFSARTATPFTHYHLVSREFNFNNNTNDNNNDNYGNNERFRSVSSVLISSSATSQHSFCSCCSKGLPMHLTSGLPQLLPRDVPTTELLSTKRKRQME